MEGPGLTDRDPSLSFPLGWGFPVGVWRPPELIIRQGFYLIAMRRGEWPNPWIWEIFYRGEPLRDRIWGGYFKSEAKAISAGQSKLDELRHRRSEILV
jgi:hypothetical protein